LFLDSFSLSIASVAFVKRKRVWFVAKMLFSSLIPVGVATLSSLANVASGAQLTKVPDFGPNPSNIEMFIYVPDKLAPNPPVILAVSSTFRLLASFLPVAIPWSLTLFLK
jgi:hypothetical protein